MSALPEPFAGWFAARGWRPHPHQLALLGSDGPATLLIALAGGARRGLHTLYVSPLKALAADIGRNLRAPVAEMGLAVRVEDRTDSTPASRRRRQRADPPEIRLTTPESLALMLARLGTLAPGHRLAPLRPGPPDAAGEAMRGLVDFGRIEETPTRIAGASTMWRPAA